MVLKSVSSKMRSSGYNLTSLLDKQTDFKFSSTLSKSQHVISNPLSNKFFFKYWLTNPSLYRLKL